VRDNRVGYGTSSDIREQQNTLDRVGLARSGCRSGRGWHLPRFLNMLDSEDSCGELYAQRCRHERFYAQVFRTFA
jgi:hypothetical protein